MIHRKHVKIVVTPQDSSEVQVMMVREFARAKFSTDALEKITFDGFTDGVSWNGWACPYFTQEIARTILAASEKNGYSWRFDDESGAFLVWHIGDPADFEPEKFEGGIISMDGIDLIVYAIGAYSWTWETC